MAEPAAVLRVSTLGGSALEHLRAVLPAAKTVASGQFRGPVWEALLAAEQLLADLDCQNEQWRLFLERRDRVEQILSQAYAGTEPALEAGP